MTTEQAGPFVLVILDGWGITTQTVGNAILLADTPVMDSFFKKYPHTLLQASGKQVGLPPYQSGNSEAGHMNIGAGRVVEQDSVHISRSINDGIFFKNPAFITALDHVKKHDSKLHLMGLFTAEQSAHADPDHVLALMTLTRLKRIKKVYLHLFTDGRDSYQYLAIKLLQRFKKTLGTEKIATVMGRFYSMDRNKEWKRTKMAYEALVQGKGRVTESADDAILQAYNRQENDEYIKPTVVKLPGREKGQISDNDAVIFFNLRSDRVRQLTKTFVQPDFDGFERKKRLKNLKFIALTDFGPDLPGVLSAYPARFIKNTLPMALDGLRQLYVAETEKYAHMTYFFNGGYDHPVAGEDRVIIHSPHAYSYRDLPSMSAREITKVIIDDIGKQGHDFIAVNYANPDMVAHTGDLNASVEAVEVVDECLGKLHRTVLEHNGTMIITADHGNVEEVIDPDTEQVDTAHSNNPVPFIIINKKISNKEPMKKGALCDIGPTILHMLHLPKPKEMGNKILCQYQINQQS